MGSQENPRGTYTYKGSGTNKDVRCVPVSNNFLLINLSQDNHWCSRDYGLEAANQNPYHYSNRDGSYYYSNPDGSKYYNNCQRGSWSKQPGEDSWRETARSASSQDNVESHRGDSPSSGDSSSDSGGGVELSPEEGHSESEEGDRGGEGSDEDDTAYPSGYDSGRDDFDSNRLDDDYDSSDFGGAGDDDDGDSDDDTGY